MLKLHGPQLPLSGFDLINLGQTLAKLWQDFWLNRKQHFNLPEKKPGYTTRTALRQRGFVAGKNDLSSSDAPVAPR